MAYYDNRLWKEVITMILFVILLIVGCILAILMFIDGITNEQLEQEKAIQKRIDEEVNKRLENFNKDNEG